MRLVMWGGSHFGNCPIIFNSSSSIGLSKKEIWPMSGNEKLTVESFREIRSALIEQSVIDPDQLATELTDLSDNLLKSLYPDTPDTALLALGSYADCELTPNSDLDVVLVHRPKVNVENLAQSIWYPIWDSGVKIDNSVRTPKEATTLALSDPRVLNGLCRPRLIAGDVTLLQEIDALLKKNWNKKRKSLLSFVVGYARQRHQESGELAYLLEPDLKEAKGGLRDFSVIKALEHLEGEELLGSGLVSIYEAQKILGHVRVMLHYKNSKATNRLTLQDQDAVAEALDYRDADRLMEGVAQAGKSIAFAFDTISRKLIASVGQPTKKKINLPKPFVARNDEIDISLPEGIRPDFSMLLKLAVLAGSNDLHISESALEIFADANLRPPKKFTEDEFLTFISFLSLGRQMVTITEALDHFHLFEVIIPEWKFVRAKPQRNAYHTFTVDRHLIEAVINAAGMRRRVRRPDLLLIAALLHDIGKGFPGDHTEAGVAIVPTICERFGMNEKDIDTVVLLVRNHLTLADTATRRDITDPSTIDKVAEFLKDPLVVEILEVLTEADSRATGPSAWSSWKAKLIAELASKTLLNLKGIQPEQDSFPGNDFDQLIEQAGSSWAMQADSETLSLVAPDKPGLFALVTGTLALVGADILSARISSKGSMAIENFQLQPGEVRPIDWNRFRREMQKSLDDAAGLHQRINEKAKNYARTRRRSGVKLVPPRVVVAPDASSRATVVEVWAPNRIGLLYDISNAISQMSLSIAHAKVLTLGDDVVDSFYLTDSDGAPISDLDVLGDLSAALVEVLGPKIKS